MAIVSTDYMGSARILDTDDHELQVNADGSINVVVPVPVPVTDNGGSLTVDGTVTANAGTGNFIVKPYSPAGADLLSGGASVANSTTQTTIITVPAGRTWRGSISVSLNNIGGANSTFNTAVITTLGAGAFPAAGTNIMTLASNAKGQTGGDVSRTINDIHVIAPGGNSVTITVQLSLAVATLRVDANANGVLL